MSIHFVKFSVTKKEIIKRRVKATNLLSKDQISIIDVITRF